ncbi:MAG TPA: FAD-dependent oxidoreductase [Mycobacteriales bacterium]|nr:FAD-dependent oxidoreductase [Mycobacteriales bacterium]
MDPYVIVGAGLAGAKAAETLRAEGFEGPVVLLGDEAEVPYERPPLSKGYLLGKDARESAAVHPLPWYDEQGIDLRLESPVTALDPAAHEVELAGGERLRYGKLLLTTGSVVRPLDVPGGDRVRTLRKLPDADDLKQALTGSGSGGGRVVVVGAGWIGLEVTAAAREYGAEVTLIETLPQPLSRVLGDELGAVFADLHRAHGVDLRLNSGVAAIGDDGVTLPDGSTVPADLVVAGVGIRPDTRLAEEAGLAVDNGVLVDASLRSSDPDIYAAGDVANVDTPQWGRVRVEHWANALNGGPAAARAMLGQDVSYDRVPYFFSDQYDLGLEYSGWAPPGSYDQIVIRGDKAAREFVAFYLSQGKVLAGMNVNVWDVTDPIQDLVRRGTPVDQDRLADPAVPLTEVAPQA